MSKKKLVNEPIMYLVTREGECHGVQLSLELWEKVENHVKAVSQKHLASAEDPFLKAQPLEALAELKEYWDFTYPYEPTVMCEACGANTPDWETDPAHPFHLTNANIGGLLVFLCRCGATVRKKHFHRKFVFECTPKDENC